MNKELVYKQLTEKTYPIYISKENKEKFIETGDVSYYQKGIFNNIKNKTKIKTSFAVEILKIISYFFGLVSLFFLIPIGLDKNLANFFGYFYFATLIFSIFILIFNDIFYLNVIRFLSSKNNKRTLVSYLLKEYLTCKYELVKQVNLSGERILQIKEMFSNKILISGSSDDDKKSKIKIQKSWNDSNYNEKIEKILKNIYISAKYYYSFIFLLGILMVIVSLLVYVV